MSNAFNCAVITWLLALDCISQSAADFSSELNDYSGVTSPKNPRTVHQVRRRRRQVTEDSFGDLLEMVEELGEDLKTVLARNKHLTEKLDHQDSSLKLLQYTNDELMTRMEELEGANWVLTQANKQLNSTIKIMDDKNNALSSELTALDDEREMASLATIRLNNKTEKLLADLGVVQKKQRFSKMRLDGLSSKTKKNEESINDLVTKGEVLQDKLGEANQEIRALHSGSKGLESKVNDLENFGDESESRFGLVEGSISSLDKAKDQLFTKLGILETSNVLIKSKLKGVSDSNKELQTDIWKIENWKIENMNRTMHSKIWNLGTRLEDARGRMDGKLGELKNNDDRLSRDIGALASAVPGIKELIEELKVSVTKVQQCQIGYINNPTDPLSGYGASGQEIGVAFKHPFKEKPTVKLALSAITGLRSAESWTFIGGRGREVLGIRGTDHSTIGGPSVVTKDGFRVTMRASKEGEGGRLESLYMMYVACGVWA